MKSAKSIDIEVSTKTAVRVSSILLSILLRKSIVDIDIDTTKVSSMVSMSISIRPALHTICPINSVELEFISDLSN